MVEKTFSIIEILGLPSALGASLLLFALILSVAPWLPGADFGIFKIPDFADSVKRCLRILGPVIFILAILFHLPIFPGHTTTKATDEPSHRAKPNAASESGKGFRGFVHVTSVSDVDINNQREVIQIPTHLYEGPSFNHQLIKALSKGERVNQLSKEGNWVEVFIEPKKMENQ